MIMSQPLLLIIRVIQLYTSFAVLKVYDSVPFVGVDGTESGDEFVSVSISISIGMSSSAGASIVFCPVDTVLDGADSFPAISTAVT